MTEDIGKKVERATIGLYRCVYRKEYLSCGINNELEMLCTNEEKVFKINEKAITMPIIRNPLICLYCDYRDDGKQKKQRNRDN